ncbi:MAG: group III truncated hemoglobin [Planctomycetota bacterium]|nr:MAG: group III truncated hemoglobin [Planctomycetota bacterium]
MSLSEPTDPIGARSAVTDTDIRRLVEAFYTRVREDDLLGPIFAREVAEWSRHLPKMTDFWSTVILRTGRYAGRPIEAHLRIDGLSPDHFRRWLGLWESTVGDEMPPEARDAFVLAARRMASSMQSRLFPAGGPH